MTKMRIPTITIANAIPAARIGVEGSWSLYHSSSPRRSTSRSARPWFFSFLPVHSPLQVADSRTIPATIKPRTIAPSQRLLTLPPPRRSADVGLRPPSNVCGCPEMAPRPAGDRRREVWLTPKLVRTLFAHAVDLGDVDDSKELPPRHTPQYP
jgi:hypothetical protein